MGGQKLEHANGGSGGQGLAGDRAAEEEAEVEENGRSLPSKDFKGKSWSRRDVAFRCCRLCRPVACSEDSDCEVHATKGFLKGRGRKKRKTFLNVWNVVFASYFLFHRVSRCLTDVV